MDIIYMFILHYLMENQDENSHLNTRLLQIIEESEVPEKMKPYLHDGISRMEKNLPSLTNPFERLNFLHFYVSAKMDASQL